MTIGTKIRTLREQRGLTQEALGQLCGCWQTTISMIENGSSAPSWNLAQKIANALGVTLPELVAIEPAATEPALEPA